MSDTAFRITDAMRARLAKIHMRGEDGSLAAQMDLEIPQEPEFEMGGGGLYGTVGDYLRFIRLILNRGRANGEQLLAPETIDMMSRNQMGDLRVCELKTAIPPFSNDAEFFPRDGEDLGPHLHDQHRGGADGSVGGKPRLGRARQLPSSGSTPPGGSEAAYLTQVLPFVDAKSFPLYLAFEEAVYENLA